jgi:hypothetical protein
MYLTMLLIEHMLQDLKFDEETIERIMGSCFTFTMGGVIHSLNLNKIAYNIADVDDMFDYMLKMRGLIND